jgi:hypothetical protein
MKNIMFNAVKIAHCKSKSVLMTVAVMHALHIMCLLYIYYVFANRDGGERRDIIYDTVYSKVNKYHDTINRSSI